MVHLRYSTIHANETMMCVCVCVCGGGVCSSVVDC